jgi:hypothetical protein
VRAGGEKGKQAAVGIANCLLYCFVSGQRVLAFTVLVAHLPRISPLALVSTYWFEWD